MREQQAFVELVDPIRTRMMRLVWRIVRNPDRAEDALQEALAVIWKKLDRIVAHPNPTALALRICTNCAIDSLRRQRRWLRFAGSDAADRLAAPEPGDWLPGEIEAEVRRAVGRLPRNQATAVVLRILEDQPYTAIAAAMGCSENTARTHVLRGRAKLGRWLARFRPRQEQEDRP
jgi:RNA polymerase sigma-70 factor (ECF subfamily)